MRDMYNGSRMYPNKLQNKITYFLDWGKQLEFLCEAKKISRKLQLVEIVGMIVKVFLYSFFI